MEDLKVLRLVFRLKFPEECICLIEDDSENLRLPKKNADK